MKATLEFNLDDPDDKKAHLRCVKSLDMSIVLFEILTNLRKSFNNHNGSQDYSDGVEDVFQSIGDLLEIHGIVIDDLIE